MGNGTKKWPSCGAVHLSNGDTLYLIVAAIPGSLLAGVDLAEIPLFLVAFSTHRLSSANTGRYRGSDGLLNLQM